MAGYNYAKFISDFGGRTLENIQVIDDLRAKDIAGNKKSKEEIEKAALEAVASQLNGATPKKVIVVPGRLVNIII